MDRQAWIAISLCVVGLVLWQVYMTTHSLPPAKSSSNTSQPIAPASVAPAPSALSLPSPTATPSPQPLSTPVPFAEKTETLRNSDLELVLTNRGGGIAEAILPTHAAENGRRLLLNAIDRNPIGAIVETPSTPVFDEFAITRLPDGSVQFQRTGTDQVRVTKKFSLPAPVNQKDNYLAKMEVDFHNQGSQVYNKPGYFVELGAASPIHERDMPSYTRVTWCIEGKARSIDVNWFAPQNYPFVGVQKRAAQEFYSEKLSGAEWLGVSNQFFVTLITPLNAKATEVWGQRVPIKHPPETREVYAIEGAMGMPGFQLQPGQSATVQFQIYAGPKLYGRLAKLDHDEAEIMDFGMWKLVSQTLLNLMNLLHRLLGNYALAILVLTAIIKLILWPLQTKANKSMRRMSALSPKMQELREKYKDDPTRMNQEVMKLYKDYGINPVSGCLPMMIQIPIFFGLFTMLRQAVELRNASFLWVRDLSQPDTVGHLPVLGWPINILPLIMAATNLWLMRMTPKTGDATQQRVMMFMPLIFVVFCYNFAAALALYYTTQNLFTILQLYQNQKQPPPTLEKVAVAGKRSRKAK